MDRGGGWNPWAALRRLSDLGFDIVELPPGVRGAYFSWSDGAEGIGIAPGLTQIERNATLAHELVHAERGALPDGAPAHVVAREERTVREETARRLAPADLLVDLELEAWHSGPITVAEVAERLGVPLEVAKLACALLDRAQ